MLGLPPPYHLLPSPGQRRFCPWKGCSLVLVLWKHGTLDMSHPFSIVSGHAEQDRTHAYTHTHRQLPKTCLITSTCCLSSLLTAWASAPKFQAIVCIS